MRRKYTVMAITALAVVAVALLPSLIAVAGFTLSTSGTDVLTDHTMRVQVYKDFGFNVVASDDEFDLEREGSTAVWVQSEGAIYTHGSDLGRTSEPPYVKSDSRIYKYVPGSDPTVIANLPSPLHHLGMAYSPDTGLIYTYGGGVDFTGGGNQIFWIDPATETTGTAAEVLPYDLVGVNAVYSTVQKKTYLFGGFVTAAVGALNEIWRHDPLTGEVIQLGATLPGDARVFQAAVYVEPEDAIYLFGGLGEDVLTSYQDIYRFAVATETIELLAATTPDPMSKYMGAYYDPVLNAVVLAGGRHGPYGSGFEEGYTTRMWAFDLDDYSTYVMNNTIMGFVDDLAGVYNPDNGKGYFMRVTPEGYTGFSEREPHSYGDSAKYIAEVSSYGVR
ncbi:MAG: kelch repeat-containing protein [Candidatus Bathyanammoxibius sp.]